MVPLATIGGGLGALRSEPGFRMDGAGHGALRSLGTGLGVGLGGLGGSLGALALNEKLDLTPGQAQASKYLPLLTALLGGIAGHQGTKAVFGKSLTERAKAKEKERAAARAEVLEDLFGQKEAYDKQANRLASIAKVLKSFGKRTALPAAGVGGVSYGVGRHHGYESGQESVKDMTIQEIFDRSRLGASIKSPKQTANASKEAAGKPGLWANIHAKRKRGEKPAKPGDEDYPDAKSWKKTTNESKKKTKK